MATRIGIELSPAACRIVEIEGHLPWRRSGGDTRVRSFAILPPSGPEVRAKLASLRRRQAAVVVWGGRSEHRQVMVTAGSYESMRAEAMAALGAAGVPTTRVWADIAPATPPDDRAVRRPVVVSMASASHLAEALQPVREAGIRVRTVTTPAVALGSLGRLRRALAVPGAIESYVALDERVTCIALVRNGVLLAARELPWGFVDEDYAHSQPRSRDDLTARLATAIGGFVAGIGAGPTDVGQVCVCGALPELRSMSALLMERLDVEVEPLDSLFGIDPARLPEPADEFRERGAELRLAWAAAADWPAAINLLRARKRRESKAWLARAAVVAGAAAGLGGSWWVVEHGRLRPVPSAPSIAANTPPRDRAPATKPALRVTGPVMPPAADVTKPPVMVPPLGAVRQPPAVTTPLVAGPKPVVATPPPVAVPKPAVTSPPAAVAKPAVTSPPAAIAKSPVTPRPTAAPPAAVETRVAVVPSPPVVERPPVVVRRPPVAVRPPVLTPAPPAAEEPPVVAPSPERREPAAARMRPGPAPEAAVPFDAVLGTILYSADRQLAIVDNRIVGVGDEVRGARVVEITAGAVMLRDPQGRLRRLALGAGGR
ncbi:MAG: hypothetical protein JWL71_3645 [Acidobacteria bacterium]|nr:hypothetical protein [Acidobacteriota bacterium]